ncbi:MAG: T9SS type A sorting domain-containing protein, partial [Saprospiraceae bacterium]|nr:T9SS type A sorting domain-containing protein [Saprospiraceae bacterium]
ANHTFNNCGNNIAPGTAFEPGSGSTIMSYSGLCGDQNIQGPSDDYYHTSSLSEIYQFLELGNGNACPSKVTSENMRPEVNFPYEDNFFIPIETPFYLEADGTDDNGDVLRYSFEQFDLGPVSALGTPEGNAPAFISEYPKPENFRYFPSLDNVINNSSNVREVLPSYTRDLTFRVTVRDYNEIIGSANWDEVYFHATSEAGPFLVEYPNTQTTVTAGSDMDVLWDPANTDGEIVNCKQVNILLSTNGGFDFDIVLATEIPNDGSHTVVIPDITSSNARIKVEASHNVFYDMSDTEFSIEAPVEQSYNFTAGPFIQQACLPSSNEVSINSLSILDYDSPITLKAIGLPPGAVANFDSNPLSPGETTAVTFDLNNVDTTGLISVVLQGISELGDTVDQEVQLDLYSNNFGDLVLVTPLENQEGVSEVPDFSWEPSVNADTYTIEIADNPSFSESSILESASGLVDPNFSPGVLLPKTTPIYWRVAPTNICGKGEFTGINVFHTEALTCSSEQEYDLNILLPLSPAVREHSITFFEDGTINDLNVANINITYSPVVSLTLTLTGPDGTSVLLMENQCGGTSAVNLGYDDQAPGLLPCPANTGIRYKPIEALSVFNGKNVKGDWTLRVETTLDAFNTGKINGWSLEVCSNVNQQGPVLVNNEVLPVQTNDSQVFEPLHLLAEDENNSSQELVFTIMDGIDYGTLFLNDMPLKIGDQFSQADINSYRLTYEHNGDAVTEDFFHFNVSDGEGGFIGKTKFLINIDDDNLPLGSNEALQNSFTMFPNPTTGFVQFEFETPIGPKEVIGIIDLNGKELARLALAPGASNSQINLGNLAPGFYLVKRYNPANLLGINKLIIQR